MNSENEALHSEIFALTTESAAAKDELAAFHRALAAEQAAAEEQRRVLDRRIKQLIDEKTKVETLCANAQVVRGCSPRCCHIHGHIRRAEPASLA